MEANYCYKFTTIKNYIEIMQSEKIKVILDVGANVGDMSLMMHSYFPTARIYAFEPVKEYYEIALSHVQHIEQIEIFHRAVTSQHLFADDLGKQRRDEPVNLRILKGLPEAGPGWAGGSVVVPEDHELITRVDGVAGFEKLKEPPEPQTLTEFLKAKRIKEVDLLKMDCEGCEHSVLGCASVAVLKTIRFITGEYHGIERFYQVMQNKLFETHKVNLIGTKELGCFFAERLNGEKDGILKYDKTGMLLDRPWLSDTPLDWHLFDEAFVLAEDRYWHALQ